MDEDRAPTKNWWTQDDFDDDEEEEDEEFEFDPDNTPPREYVERITGKREDPKPEADIFDDLPEYEDFIGEEDWGGGGDFDPPILVVPDMDDLRPKELQLLDRRYGPLEYKYIDTNWGSHYGRPYLTRGGFDGSSYGYNGRDILTRIPKGYDRNQMVGNSIKLRSLDMRISLLFNIANEFYYYKHLQFCKIRIIVIMDKHAKDDNDIAEPKDFANPDGTVPPEQLLLSFPLDLHSYYVIENLKRWKVLLDREYEINTKRSPAQQILTFGDPGDPSNLNVISRVTNEGTLLRVVNKDATTLKGEISLNQSTLGELAGVDVIGEAQELTAVTTNTVLSDNNINFGEVDIKTHQHENGSTDPIELSSQVPRNNINQQWTRAYDVDETYIKIHIDLDEIKCRTKDVQDGGFTYGQLMENSLHFAILVVSPSAEPRIFSKHRITYYD